MKNSLEEYKAKIAINARALRSRAGISQEELAARAGIDRTYASQIERGIANPSLEVLVCLAEALEVGLHELLCKEPRTG